MTHILHIKNRTDKRKLLPFLEPAGRIYLETGLTFEVLKYVYGIISHELLILYIKIIRSIWRVVKLKEKIFKC